MDAAGRLPLHYAAMADRVDEVSSLIDAGAEVNARAKDRFTPLHLAAQEGALAVADFLV